jgi:hypothetical protein
MQGWTSRKPRVPGYQTQQYQTLIRADMQTPLFTGISRQKRPEDALDKGVFNSGQQ